MKPQLLFSLILGMGVCLSIYASGQIVGDYRSFGAGTNWATAANWERCAVAGVWPGVASASYPGQLAAVAGTTVTVRNGHTRIIAANIPNSIVNLLVGEGTSGVMSVGAAAAGSGYNLTCTGSVTVATGATLNSAGDDVGDFHILNFQSTLINNGAINFTAATDQITLNVTGATTNNGTLTFATNLGIKTFIGAVSNTGTWTSTTLANTANLVFRNGVSSTGGTFAAGGATFNTNSPRSIGGTAAMSFSGIVTVAAGITITNDNTNTLTMSNTGVALASGGAGSTFTQGTTGNTLSYGGSSIGVANFNASGVGNIVNYSGVVAQAVRDVAYNNLTISGTNTATLTLTANRIVGGILTVNAGSTLTTAGNFTLGVTGNTSLTGTLNLGGNSTKTFTGDVTLNAGSTWNETSNAAINFGGSLTNNATTFTANTGTHTFTGAGEIVGGATTTSIPTANFTASYTNTGNFTSATSLTITNPAVLTNNGTITATSALAGIGGLTQGATGILNIGGTSTVALTATAVGNSVNYTGAAGQTVLSTNYYNLGMSGGGAKGLQAGTATIGGDLTLSGNATTATVVNLGITGNLTIGDGNTFTAANSALTVTGTTTVGGGTSGTLVISSATGAKTFTGDITLNAGSTWNETANAVVNVGGNLTNDAGNFTAGTGLHSFTGTSKTLSGGTTTDIPNAAVSGSYTNDGTLSVSTALTGAGSLTQGGTGVLNIGGTSPITTLVATTVGNTVNFDGAAQTVKSTNYYNLTLSGSAAKTLQAGTTSVGGNLSLSGTASTTAVGALSIGGSVTLGTGTTFTAGAFTHNVGGDWTNNGGTFTNTGSTINLNGAAQSIGGTSTTAFNNLTFTGNGLKTLSTTPSIVGNLVLGGTASTTAVAALTVGGDVTLGTGTTFTAGAFTHNVAGNWTNNGGTFSNAGSTINLNGAAQSIGGSTTTTFNNLTLAGTNTKTFNIATAIASRLTINTGVAANLGSITTHTANMLYFAVAGQAAGTWGGNTSAATNTNSTFFATATGILTVAVQGSTTYYSRQAGNWNANTTWSTVTYGNATNLGTFPVAGDIVNIGGGDFLITVNVNSACTTLNFQSGANNSPTVAVNTGITFGVSGAISFPSASTGFGNDVNTLAVGAGTLNAGSIDFSTGGVLGGHSLTISTGTATISGDVTQSGLSPASVVFTNSGLLRLGGDMPNYCSLTPSTGTVEYFGTAAQNISSVTNLLTQTSYNNLIFSGVGVKTAGGDTDINGVFTLASGTSFIGGPFTYTLAGNWINNGTTFTNTNFTVSLNGTAQTIGGSNATTFYNLTLAGSGTKAFGLSTTIDGSLSINTGVVANLGTITTHTARTLALNGAGQVSGSWGSTASAATNQSNTYFTAAATGILNVSNRAYFSRATGNWNASGTWSTVTYGNATNTGAFPVAGDIANIGGDDYTVSVTAAAACASLNYQGNTTDNPTVAISNGITLNVSGAVNITSGGGLFTTGTNTLAVGGGILNAGSLGFTTDGILGDMAFTISTGTATISGDVTQTGGVDATITFTNTGSLILRGAFLNSTNCTFTRGTGTVNYNSSTVAQAIGNFTYHNLTLNNTFSSTGQLSLVGNTTAVNNLTMTSGIVNTNGFAFTLGASGTASTLTRTASPTTNWMYGGSFTRFWPTGQTPLPTGANSYGLFPLGHSTASSYRPVAITGGSNVTTTGSVTFSHVDASTSTDLSAVYDDDPTAGVINIVRKHNSQFIGSTTGVVGGTNYNISVTMTDLLAGTASDIRLAISNGATTVTNAGLHVPNSGTAPNPTVGRSGLTVANLTNDFRITTINSVATPLPIELTHFSVVLNNSIVEVSWATASERNNDYFTIERALNIEEFQVIGDPIDGKGTTTERNEYTAFDENPIYGRSYYRLKQTDFDGVFTYSPVKTIDYEGPKFSVLKVYPNPSGRHHITIEVNGLKDQPTVPVKIFNVQGQKVFDQVLDVTTPGTLKKELEFSSPLKQGLYIIKAGETLQLTQKLIVE